VPIASLVACAVAGTARADDLSTDERPVAAAHEPTPSKTLGPQAGWYGWQVLTLDGVTFTTFFGTALATAFAAQRNTNTLETSLELEYVAGLTHYAFDGFAVHAAHRHWVSAGVSLGLRLLLPVLGGLAGDAAQENPFDKATSAAEGVAVGMFAAILVDATALSFATAPPTATKSAGVQWFPLVNVSPGDRRGPAASLGIGASF
jgi:hypothetical protein